MSASARVRAVALGVAWRNLHHALTNPALLLPSVLFPLFFLTAFAGGLSRVGSVPGFDFPSGYTAFQFVFVLLQASAFGGVFTGFSIARDFESGFTRRLLLAAPRRSGIVLGYMLAAMARALLVGSIVFVVALLTGMRVGGDGVDLVGLIGLALLTNVAATMWAVGVAMRIRSMQAAPVMQMPIFILLFLAPVYVPIDLLSGWIHTVAQINPVTALVEAGRGFISGRETRVVVAFAAGAGLSALGIVWAIRGLRRAEAAG